MMATDSGPCYRCRAPIYLPDELYKAAKHSPAISFFCAYGHEQHFVAGETEADKLRRERDRLKQDAARLESDIAWHSSRREAAERQASAFKGVATKLKKRAAAGVCPCCTRTFSNMARHIATQHPDFKTTEIIPLVATA